MGQVDTLYQPSFLTNLLITAWCDSYHFKLNKKPKDMFNNARHADFVIIYGFREKPVDVKSVSTRPTLPYTEMLLFIDEHSCAQHLEIIAFKPRGNT